MQEVLRSGLRESLVRFLPVSLTAGLPDSHGLFLPFLPFLLLLSFGAGLFWGWVFGVKMWQRLGSWSPAAAHRFTSGEEVKMTLVVRKDLKMSAGKIAAQCAHAAVAVVEEVFCLKAAYLQPGTIGGDGVVKKNPYLERPPGEQHPWIRWHERWRGTGSMKVVLQCPDEASLRTIAALAKEKSLPYYLVRDAGRTQIAAGSRTVLAIGPGPKNLVDQVTGTLKLL